MEPGVPASFGLEAQLAEWNRAPAVVGEIRSSQVEVPAGALYSYSDEGSWKREAVDAIPASDALVDPNLVVYDGTPRTAYWAGRAGEARYVRRACTGWETWSIDEAVSDGNGIGLAEIAGRLAVAYVSSRSYRDLCRARRRTRSP